ncbi:MAG: ribokinase, partial [Chloroflexaceae bacterium]|nr:ribokinase [Chloroflexaceae bacterium]
METQPKPPMLVVVGSLNMDLVVQTPVLPAPGQTVQGGPFATFPGGKGANQAVAAARAGARVQMVGCVGADGYGTLLREGLAAEGIDTALVQVHADVATGVALIAVDQYGQNTIIAALGANLALTAADVQQAADAIAQADVLLLQLETPLPAIRAAAALAHTHGTRVLLNPAPAPDESERAELVRLLPLIDVLIPNESEAALL